MTVRPTLSHLLLSIRVRLPHEKVKHIVPLLDILAVFVSCYKIALKRKMPLNFSIGFFVYFPSERSAL